MHLDATGMQNKEGELLKCSSTDASPGVLLRPAPVARASQSLHHSGTVSKRKDMAEGIPNNPSRL
jgi:hypothetical protein